jgi:hypothetical protein
VEQALSELQQLDLLSSEDHGCHGRKGGGQWGDRWARHYSTTVHSCALQYTSSLYRRRNILCCCMGRCIFGRLQGVLVGRSWRTVI